MLKKKGISIKVLNAKYHELEAEIVAKMQDSTEQSRLRYSIRGRGTDIKLDDAAKRPEGTKIIGTERHESDVLTTNCADVSGRQGDQGESRFYILWRDDLRCVCLVPERLMSVFNTLGVEGRRTDRA